MELGEPTRVIVVEPLELPEPLRAPVEVPAEPMPVLEPERVPA